MLHVHFITYRGKQYPINIAYWVLKKAAADNGKTEIEFVRKDGAFNTEVVEKVLWWGLKSGHRVQYGHIPWIIRIFTRPFLLRKSDMEKMLDESMDQFMLAVSESMARRVDEKGEKKSRVKPMKKTASST